MHDLEELSGFVRTGIASVAAGALASEQGILFARAGQTLAFFLVALLAVILSYLCAFFCKKALENWDFGRKLVLGSRNIEGCWTDTVLIDGSNITGVIDISMGDDGYDIHGIQYDEKDSVVATWQSIILTFERQVVKYVYETRYQATGILQHGYSEITFDKHGKGRSPTSCSGHFHDLGGSGANYHFRATKKTNAFRDLFQRDPAKALADLRSIV